MVLAGTVIPIVSPPCSWKQRIWRFFNNKLNQLYPLDSISLRQLLKDCSFGRLLSGLLQMK